MRVDYAERTKPNTLCPCCFANAQVHATTGEIPLARLELERECLQPMPPPWPGMIQRSRTKPPASTPGYQHSLTVYEELITADLE